MSARVLAVLRTVPDFPSAGILFKDITPLLADPGLLRDAIRDMRAPFASAGITHVAGIESRGFLFGVPIALALDAAFVPMRKTGKLPWHTVRHEFALEYGTDALEVHTDAFSEGARVLVVDDVLATGGTAAAACHLVQQLGGRVAGISTLLEITALAGRSRLAGHTVHTVAVC